MNDELAKAAGDAGLRLLCAKDLEQVERMVQLASRQWLSRDLRKYRRCEIQREFRIEGLFTGFADLILSDDDSGSALIVEWKTSSSVNQAVYALSWQGRLYSWAFGIHNVEYRIVTPSLECASVPMTFGWDDWVEAMNQVLACRHVIESLRHFPYWPKVNDYDKCRVCALSPTCFSKTKPQGLPSSWPPHLSYTSMALLMHCPEKFRLHVWMKEKEDRITNLSMAMGKAFEAAITKVYESAFTEVGHEKRN